jgi:hypothetical protein
MFLHGCGVRLVRSLGRSPRQGKSAHLAVVRVEVLEDRFLLSGAAAKRLGFPTRPMLPHGGAGVSAAILLVDEAVRAGRPMIGAVPVPRSQVTGSTGSGARGSSISVAKTLIPVGAKDRDKPKQGGTTVLRPGMTLSPEIGPGMSGATGGDHSGEGGIAPIPVPFTILLPSPVPRAVPAGGVFQQLADRPSQRDGEEPSPDSVAMDSFSLVPIADAPAAIAVALHGLGLSTPAGRAAEAPLGIDVSRPPTSAAPRRRPTEQPGGPGPERAELPDLLAPDPTAGPTPPRLDEDRSNGAGRSSETMSAHGANVIPETRRGEHRLAVRLAIYGAASLIIGVSAPGLIVTCGRNPARERDRDSAGKAEVGHRRPPH